MNGLAGFLDAQAARHGPRLAIQYRPRYRSIRWTYDDLRRRVGALQFALARQEVAAGDRVLLFAENSPDWVAAFFAIAATGAVVVPVNPRSPAEPLERLVASAEPKLLLLSSRAIWPASLLPDMRIQTVAAEEDAGPMFAAGPETLAEIIYTSGTTGNPKGVMLTHGNLLADLEAVAKAVPLEPHHHVVSLVPLFHAYGQMTSLLCPLRAGCAVSYLSAPTSRAILEALAQAPATHLVAVPEVLKTMMDRLESRLGRIPGWLRKPVARRLQCRLFGSLHTIVCGGAALDPVVEEKWRALGFEVLQGYGLTETSPVLAANTPLCHRTGSVGQPLDGVELRIAADGEVQVRGPMVMPGYYRDPEHTAAAFVDGWFRTDDAGRLDEDGFLYVFGRKRYMILGPGGENVFPEDIEAELNRVSGVTDSAVVGLAKAGRTVVHAVLLCEPGRAGEAVTLANANLAPHQHVMSWSVWPEADFPRSVTRKVRKEEVIARLSGHSRVEAALVERITPLRRLLAQVTGMPPAGIGEATRLVADLGVDSLLRIELVSRLEDEWGTAVEEAQITPQTRVADLEALLERRQRTPPRLSGYPRWSLSPWAQALRPWVQRVLFESWILPCCRLRVEGAGHLADLQGPAIFMANHRSFLDSAIATFALPDAIRWRLGIAAGTQVLYRQYRWAVPFGELGLNAFPFPTEADENIRPGLDYMGRLLDGGWNVLVFPEGRMNREGRDIQTLKGGAGVIAVEMQVHIVPVVIEGTERVMPPGMIVPRARGEVVVRFGKPECFAPDEGYAAATVRIETRLRELLGDRIQAA